MEPGKVIEFNKSKYFTFIRELGSGGTGTTYLFKDEFTDTLFAIKKYDPKLNNTDHREENFERFIDEIKILLRLSHPNIVRIYNYYLYPEYLLGYIQMEFVEGVNINDYIRNNQENLELIFRKSINAFKCLEENNILHRDIRSNNIMITNDGNVKVIDFGFGKELSKENEENSVLLNWPVTESPNEIRDHEEYSTKTEIYYLGHLFDKLIRENSIEEFRYKFIIDKMCQPDPNQRYNSFEGIEKELTQGSFIDLDFTEREKSIYIQFAEQLYLMIAEYSTEFKPVDNVSTVLSKFEGILLNSSLETYIQNNAELVNCFIENGYKYKSKPMMQVETANNFYQLLANSTPYKQKIIINNLNVRLENIPLKVFDPFSDDGLPF